MAAAADGAAAQSSSGAIGIRTTSQDAVIPKGTTHEFWKSVHAGAVKASRELDVDIVWKGPLKEDDLKAQIERREFVRGAGCIRHRRRAAQRQRAPCTCQSCSRRKEFQSSCSTPICKATTTTSFVATDNQAAGKIAATR